MFQSSSSSSLIDLNADVCSCFDIAQPYRLLASQYELNLDSPAGSNLFPIYSLLALAWRCDTVAVPPLMPHLIVNNMSESLNNSS